jgi:Flp pilus assembly protein TadB
VLEPRRPQQLELPNTRTTSTQRKRSRQPAVIEIDAKGAAMDELLESLPPTMRRAALERMEEPAEELKWTKGELVCLLLGLFFIGLLWTFPLLIVSALFFLTIIGIPAGFAIGGFATIPFLGFLVYMKGRRVPKKD